MYVYIRYIYIYTYIYIYRYAYIILFTVSVISALRDSVRYLLTQPNFNVDSDRILA